jgi:hypothetical protein
VPASDLAGAGMRRHVHPGNHAAESFVSFIRLFGRSRIVLVAPPLEDEIHQGSVVADLQRRILA